MPTRAQPDLFVIGLGVMIPGHVTLQATRAIVRCNQLFSIVQESPRLWIPPDKLRQIDVVNALDWYAEDSLRTQNYDRVAQRIVESLSKERTLGYVTYGNPMAYDRVAQHLVDYAGKAGFTVHVVPGISSLDTIFCDLRADLAPGVQVYEASWMVACQIHPRTDVAMLLMQVGAFGSLRTHYTKRQDGRSLTDLVEYLCKFYPPSHAVALVRSTGEEDQPPRVRQVTLESLSAVTAEDLSGASLYLPFVKEAQPKAEIISKMVEH